LAHKQSELRAGDIAILVGVCMALLAIQCIVNRSDFPGGSIS
jgi:hypothetical protein